MDNLYNFQYSTTTTTTTAATEFPENLMMIPSDHHHHDQLQSLIMSSPSDLRIPMFESPEAALISATASVISEAANCLSTTPTDAFQSHDEDVIKSKIASHPSYPRLLDAYIDCQKVGAPPEIANLLEKLRRENDICKRVSPSTYYGADPELDEFMETYCDVLTKYKSDLEKPFDEATAFLNKIGLQLGNLCNSGSATSILYEEGALTSDEELSAGELEVIEATQPNSEEKELKDRLIRRFGSHISSLKLEFSKKKKKGKLPKEARQTLLEWWNLHYKWPYPTEADKIALAESTGLDQKQINNWFINQRKRHWNPSENMQFAVMDNLPDPFFTDD